MSEEFIKELDGMSLEELGAVVTVTLARMYIKLRDDKEFGWDQKAFITSLGGNDYDVSGFITADEPRSDGVDWHRVWNF